MVNRTAARKQHVRNRQAEEGNLQGVLDAGRRESTSTRDQGDRFERLYKAALTAHNGAYGTQRFRRVVDRGLDRHS